MENKEFNLLVGYSTVSRVAADGLELTVLLTEKQARGIMYKFWAHYGDSALQQWLNAEGYDLIKRKQLEHD